MSGNTTIFSGSEILEFHESAIEANRFSVNIKGRGWLLSILHNGEQWVEVQRENMRRLVACWNACAGIDTQMLEGFSPGFLARYPDRVLAERLALERQSKQLLTRLVQAVEASGYSISGATDTRAAENGEPAWVCNARAEIAKANPNADAMTAIPEALASLDTLIGHVAHYGSMPHAHSDAYRDVANVQCCTRQGQKASNHLSVEMKTTAQQNAAEAARLEGFTIVGLMRKHKVTMRELKAKHCITLKRIREVRSGGVSGFLAQEWVWIITGKWPT